MVTKFWFSWQNFDFADKMIFLSMILLTKKKDKLTVWSYYVQFKRKPKSIYQNEQIIRYNKCVMNVITEQSIGARHIL